MNVPISKDGALEQGEEINDYNLVGRSCWITVGNLSVFIIDYGDCAGIEVYKHYKEWGEPLGDLLIDYEGEE